MPLYEYRCDTCGKEIEALRGIGGENPSCCGKPMAKMPTFPVMVKIKGAGGYPSRRKFVGGSAPYTSRATKAWLSEDPVDSTMDYMGTRKS